MVSETKLKIAFPSKGRLRKDLEKLLRFKKIEFVEEGNERNYMAKLANQNDILIYFMGAKEIVTQLDEGNVHLGITGDDLVQEKILDSEEKVTSELTLDFGKADLVVAVPKIWLDVTTMADLDEISHVKRMNTCLLYTSPSPRDLDLSRMPSSA